MTKVGRTAARHRLARRAESTTCHEDGLSAEKNEGNKLGKGSHVVSDPLMVLPTTPSFFLAMVKDRRTRTWNLNTGEGMVSCSLRLRPKLLEVCAVHVVMYSQGFAAECK